jgi:hypothetical protein
MPMTIADSATRAVMHRLNPTHRLNGRPFDPSTPWAAPSGVHSWAHYGVMVPGLPSAHRTFGVMAILGTPGLAVFANDHAVTTTPRDTAYVVSATAAMDAGQFATYSISQDCRVLPDGSMVAFGDDVVISGSHPDWTVERHHPDAQVRLRLTATPSVTWFARLPGGVYDHWSLLCRYEGEVDGTPVAGLATLEYARGVGLPSLPAGRLPNLPATFFSYHVINLDEQTQLLYAELRGPRGVVITRKAYLRGVDDLGAEYGDAQVVVTEHEPTARVTPDGRTMRLPARLDLVVPDRDGGELARLVGTCPGDWAYGLGAGYVGSYSFTGSFRGREVGGTAYVEYVDLASS